MKRRPSFGTAPRALVLVGMIGIFSRAAALSAGATAATGCGSLTFHASATKSATETDITVAGTTCTYAKKVFLPEAALATPAAAKFFSTWTIKATSLSGGSTEYTCRRGKVTISYRGKTS